MHTLFCVCPPRVESLFHPVLSKSCNQIPLGFKVWVSGNSSSCCRTPKLGSLTWGSEPSLQWVDFCGISVHQSVSHPPSSYGIWFYCDFTPPIISLQLLLCLWMWGIFFGEFQCLLVNDCSAVSCDSGGLARGSPQGPLNVEEGGRRLVQEALKMLCCRHWREKKRPWVQECRQPPGTRKSKEAHPPTEPPEGTQPYCTLILAQ